MVLKQKLHKQRKLRDQCIRIINRERETEKAYYLKALSDFGTLKFWCPKSCIYEREPAQAFEIGETVCTKAFGEAIVCEINEQMNAVSVKLENGEIKHLLNSSEFIWKV